MPQTSAISAVRARRRAERENPAQTPDRRTTILEATGRVLASTDLHDLTVAQIMREADVARGTFYAYFESKYEVVAALLDEVMEQMYGLLRPYVERQPGVAADDAIRQVIAGSARLWSEHISVFRATHDHRHAVAELKREWLRVTEQFTDAVAAEIDREIAAGEAPAGRDTRQLAAALVWSTEHLLYVAGSGDDDDLPGEERIIDTLVQLWVGTIYGRMERR